MLNDGTDSLIPRPGAELNTYASHQADGDHTNLAKYLFWKKPDHWSFSEKPCTFPSATEPYTDRFFIIRVRSQYRTPH